MKKSYSIILLFFLILLLSCESKKIATAIPVTFDSFYDLKHDSGIIQWFNKKSRVSIAGYLTLRSKFLVKAKTLNLILFEKPKKQGQFLSVNIEFGTNPNQAEKLPQKYSDRDLKVHTDKNEIIGYEDLVRISGIRYYHKKEDKSTYYIIIDKVEKVE